MTEKRYFERRWGDEFYIFDSQTISEKDFDEKVEYEDYRAFADSLMGDEVIDLLNELYEENQHFKLKFRDMLEFIREKGTVTKSDIDNWWNTTSME